MPGKRLVAELQDLALECGRRSGPGIRLCFKNHVGDDERTRDGVLPGPHERHPHLRVAIDHGFDFLWMNLQSANVDDPASPANEIVAVGAQLHHIAGVDEAVAVREGLAVAAQIALRGTRRADPKRAIFDLHLDAHTLFSDETRRKASETVADVERHAGLGRGERMDDPRLWVEPPEMIEDRLVGDLSRQADVLGRNPVRGRAHEGTTPMRRGPRDMGHSVRAGPDQEVAHRLLEARQYQRSPAEQGAQENLQTAVTANIVERAPDGWCCRCPPAADRCRQAQQRVHDELRLTGRPGSEEDPFRFVLFVPLRRGRRKSRAAPDERSDPFTPGFGRIPIGHERIDRCGRFDEWNVLGRQVGRTENESSRDAIKFDERQGGRELVTGRDEYGAPAKLAEASTEARSVDQIAQSNARSGSPEYAFG